MNNVDNHPHEKKMTTRLLHSNNHHFFLTPFLILPLPSGRALHGHPTRHVLLERRQEFGAGRRIDVVALLAQQRGWRPLQQQDLGCAGY